ncbi:MAG: PASTA domain-containing protein [Pyrinomonadaceae bacterium]|nr:PASTA domain-containing protein [Pyrinomonadaceae bacterium]
MSQQQERMASRKVLRLSLRLILLLLVPSIQAESCPDAAQTATPAAVVKSIVVKNQQQSEADRSQAVATRVSNGETVSVSAGLLLYRGDIIETFDETKVTLLFLDAPVAERDNEVIIDANAKVGVSSTNSWWGKIWVKVKGAFESKGTYVRLGPKGTEYEFNVLRGEERSTVVVLEGVVPFEEGRFTLAGLGRTDSQIAELIGSGTLSPSPLLTAFSHKVSGQVQTGRAVDVRAGQVTTVSGTYYILNDCKQSHYFEFRTSDRTPWLQLLVKKQPEIPAHTSLPVEASLQIDAKQLLPGQYRANVYAICLDCQSEPGCTQFQLDWPLSITVKGNPGPSPPVTLPTPPPIVTPRSSTQEGQIRELEELTLTSGFDRPVQATETRVLSVLDWTNKVILTAQPTYSAQNLIPHFPTIEQRSQSFTDARQRAILRNEPGSNAVLGNVYSDWDQGAMAVFAYEKELAPSGRRLGTFDVDKAEAYRLTGRLQRAQQLLGTLSATDSQSVPALNASGNLNLDYAEIAKDKRDFVEARKRLAQARNRYESALQSAQVTSSAQVGPRAGTTVQTNLGETALAEGDIAQAIGELLKARTHYTEATRSLESVQQANSLYPFPVTDLGRAYQGLGNVAHLQGNPSEASAAYERAERQHRQAINAHSDFAEAYFNLGDLFDDRGDKRSAEENYRLAIKARPEQPAPYYPLALLIQKEEPQLAAALAATYLQLEPEVFKQGEKAKNARLITEGQYVEPPQRPFQQRPDGQPPSDPPVTAGTVPNVLNMTFAQALSAMQTAGFVPGRIDDPEKKSTYIVIKQSPNAGMPAARGSAIDLVIGGGIEVPDVIDDKQQTAVRKITNKHLKVGAIDQEASCKSVGEVLKQKPPKKTRVAPGTVVDLVIRSVGENPLTIPDFRPRNSRPLNREEAEAALRVLGIRVDRIQTEQTDKDPEGTVLRQKPKPGSQFAENCPVKVELTIAVPIIWVNVENYVGMTIDQARQRISAVNLSPDVTYQENSAYNPYTVAHQEPPFGSRVREGSRILLVVAIPPQVPTVRVQNVFGMKPEVAKRVLEAQGLVVDDRDISYDDMPASGKTPDGREIIGGTVMRQQPAANQRVPSGTRVKLVIAHSPIGDD